MTGIGDGLGPEAAARVVEVVAQNKGEIFEGASNVINPGAEGRSGVQGSETTRVLCQRPCITMRCHSKYVSWP